MIQVWLPVGASRGDHPRILECEAATVGLAVAECVTRVPTLRSTLYDDDGRIRVAVLVNGRSVTGEQKASTLLNPGDEVRLVPPIAGG
jgi:molybdopterin converting factor small subunit